MNAPIPTENYKPGWPDMLKDVDGELYVRLRDGVPTGDFSGHSCLYALLGRFGYLKHDQQYVPTLGSEAERVTMSGGTWMDPEEFVQLGLPPITIPPEPVNKP